MYSHVSFSWRSRPFFEDDFDSGVRLNRICLMRKVFLDHFNTVVKILEFGALCETISSLPPPTTGQNTDSYWPCGLTASSFSAGACWCSPSVQLSHCCSQRNMSLP